MARLHPQPDDALLDRIRSLERRLDEATNIRRPHVSSVMLERTADLALSAGVLAHLAPDDSVETDEGTVNADGSIDLPRQGIYIASGWIELSFVGASATGGILSILENPAQIGGSGYTNAAQGVSALLPVIERQSFTHVFWYTAVGSSLVNLALMNGDAATVGNFECSIVRHSEIPGGFIPL